jgi:hypothetical protein
MDESRWDAGLAQAVNLHWIVDGATLSVERSGTVTHAYSADDYVTLLTDAGFSRQLRHPALSQDAPDTNYTVLVAST